MDEEKERIYRRDWFVIIIGGVCAILIFFWGKLFYFI